MEAYFRKIEKAGGLPLLIPHLEEKLWPQLIEQFDGFLLSGGGDIASLYFNEEPLRGQGEVFPPRDRMELYIVKQAIKRNIPLLGICRGMQVINVAAGGTIYQDIYEQRKNNLQHCQGAPRNYPSHTVEISENSLLLNITGKKTIQVNSFHHQAVCETAPGLRGSAAAADGIIEAVESADLSFLLGVQWHPESLDDPASAALFSYFIKCISSNL